MSAAAIEDRLVQALGPVVTAKGLDLEGVDVMQAGRRSLVRVMVDKDGGVTLDEISETTHAVSQHLDDSDLMEERPYTLEVTSPGTDRPLTLPRHWARNVGRLVKVTFRDTANRSAAGGTVMTGRIRSADETSARVEADGTEHDLSYDEVAKALIQVEFNRKEG